MFIFSYLTFFLLFRDGICSTQLVKIVNNNTVMLAQATRGAARFDLVAAEPAVIEPGSSTKVSTGVHIEMPKDMFALVLGRSGLALNNKIIAHTGTIDSDYRGGVCVAF